MIKQSKKKNKKEKGVLFTVARNWPGLANQVTHQDGKELNDCLTTVGATKSHFIFKYNINMIIYLPSGEKRTGELMSLKEIIEEMMVKRINPFNQDYMKWLDEEKQRKEVTDYE